MKKVLLVENDEFSVILTQKLINNICELDIAENGYEAIDLVEKSNYSLILMDINLGLGITGWETAKVIRKINGYINTPIVAITAYVSDSEKEHLFKDGVITHFISKPVDIEQFKVLISSLLLSS